MAFATYLVDKRLKSKATEEYRRAMDAFETAARLNPDDGRDLNNLAWHLALSDDPTIRNARRAVVLARRAVELAPDNWMYWDTLGVACFHAGTWDEAVTALEKGFTLLAEKSNRAHNTTSMPSEHADTVPSKLYLSLAYSRLGNIPKARLWYDNAAQWMDKNAPRDGELRRLRAEAAELLGIRQQPSVQGKESSPRKN